MMDTKYQNAKKPHFVNPRWSQQIIYAWKNVFRNFRQHWFSTLLTLLVISASLALPTISYILWKNGYDAAQQWNPTPNLTAYISKSLKKEKIDLLTKTITQFDEIKSVEYLSKQEALKEFQQWSGFSNAITLLDHNPLPAVFIISPSEQTLQSSEALHALQDKLQNTPGIDDVKLDDGWFTRLIALTNMIGKIVLILAIMMIVAVFLVISNSIRLNIFVRYDTIKVMQLIGATEGFILRPFLYNGAFFGFIGAIFAVMLAKLFVWRIDLFISNISPLFDTPFTIQGLTWGESSLLIVISILIGWLSARLATTRYLKILTTK